MVVKNGGTRFASVLTSLAWCDEVVVMDLGSTDTTGLIAAGYANVRVLRPVEFFGDFGQACRFAASEARHDWILTIDSDETVSPELAAEIASLKLDPQVVYAAPVHVWCSRTLPGNSLGARDPHERLFNRVTTRFGMADGSYGIHPARRPLTVRALRHPIRQYAVYSLDDLMRKMSVDAHLFASLYMGRKSSGPVRAVILSFWRFVRSFALEFGFVRGAEGIAVGAFAAMTEFWKYLLLHEANRRGIA